MIIFSYNNADNAGDYYCDPSLYYNFPFKIYKQKLNYIKKTINNNSNNIYIFGGGGFLDTNSNNNFFYQNLNNNNDYIIWGAGSNKLNINKISWKCEKNEINPKIDKLEKFKLIGRRDYNMNIDYDYVPCSSCKLKILDNNYKIKRKVGIVNHSWLEQINLKYDKINMNLKMNTISKIIEFIGSCEIIITSSYHGMYWATLLNKKVIIKNNWSSKFDYFKYKPVIYTGNLNEDIKKCKIYINSLSECRYYNDNFYKKIVNYIKNKKL